MSVAAANDKSGIHKETSSDLSAPSVDSASGFPPDATPTSKPQSSVEKDVLHGPTDLIPTSLNTSSGFPNDPSSVAHPAQPFSPQSAQAALSDEAVSTPDDAEEDPAFLAALKYEEDRQKVWEYCRKHLHEIGVTIDPTIELEENVDEEMCFMLLPKSHRMQEYFNERAYIGKINKVIHERFSHLGESGEQKHEVDEADRQRQLSAGRLLVRIINFTYDIVEREQGYGKYAEEVVYNFEGYGYDKEVNLWFKLDEYDDDMEEGHGEEKDGYDNYEAV